MQGLRELARRLRDTFRKQRVEAELDAEVKAHLQLLAEANERRGMPRKEAYEAARREFGGVEQMKESYREQRGLPFVETLVGDLRFAIRVLGRNPGVTALIILTLALGIGANTAIFSVVHFVLLKPLPYPQGERLAVVWSIYGNEGRAPASGPELSELRARSRLFEDFAGIWAQQGALTGEGEPEQVKLGQVTWNFLPLLSAKAQAGRYFAPQEQGSSAPKVIVLSDGLWRRRFGGDPKVVGQAVRLDGVPRTVVGILPAGFRLLFPEGSSVPPEMDAYIPFPTDLATDPADQGYIRVIGRLKEGVTLEQAQAEAEQLAAGLRAMYPTFAEQSLGLQIVALHGDVVQHLRPALLTLFAGVGFVLLIACANVANLLLSVAGERQREITVRAAMGAGRSRLVRQLLTESVLLSCLGGAAALVVAWWGLRWLTLLRPVEMERLGAMELNLVALGFTFGVALLTGIGFGLAPALSGTKIELAGSLKEGGRNSTPVNHRFKRGLIACEVSLGVVLLVGAGLMLRTFSALLRSDPGFVADKVLTFRLSLTAGKYYEPDAAVHFFRELQRDLSEVPGVEKVGVTSHLPFEDSLPNWYSYYWKEGTPKQEQNTVMADYRSIFPGYFPSIGAVLVSGRDFDQIDMTENRGLAIIDEQVAGKMWPDGKAVGKKLNVESRAALSKDFVREDVEVIGVVRHLQYHSLTDPVRGQIYLPYSRAAREHMALTIKTTGNPQELATAIRREVAKLDKDLPVYGMQPMTDYVAKARRATRFVATLAGVMAGLALMLACTGIYGVTSRAVLQRTSEIGVRMALGAQPRQVFRIILRDGMAPVIGGMIAGLVMALLLTPLISGLLFGVRPTDGPTFLMSGALLGLVAALACYLPARRATRVDPIQALRYE